MLWEHYVLNEMHARLQTRRINYCASHYPKAECLVVCRDIARSIARQYGDVTVTFLGLEALIKQIAVASAHPAAA